MLHDIFDDESPRPQSTLGPAPSPESLTLGARVTGSRLFVLTNLAAVDGTLFALAAAGSLADAGGAILAGLTVIAGAGAWSAARDEFSVAGAAGHRSRADWLALAAIAGLSTLAALASAVAGASLGRIVTLAALPYAASLAVLLVAAEIGGFRVPRVRGVSLAAVVIGAGLLAEVILSIP